MLRRLLATLVLFYLAVDFSTPMASGVFQFSCDDSVECARTEPGGDGPSKPPAAIPSAQRRPDRTVLEVVRVRPAVLIARHAPTTRAHLRPAPDPRSTSDDDEFASIPDRRPVA